MAKAQCLNCQKVFNFNPANKRGKYCCCRCNSEHKSKIVVENWLKGSFTGGKGFQLSQAVRNYLLNEANHKCTLCGWSKENTYTGKVPLHIDHINGDPFDHSPENLRVICPNCHSLTATFGSKNKGKGRYSRGCAHPKFTVNQEI